MMRNTNTKPVLRFPEFKEDWNKENLNKVFTKKSIKNKGSNVKTVLTNSATQGIVLQNDYFDKEIANQNNLEGYFIVDVDDFVYNPRISVSAPVGPLKRNKLCLGVMSPLYTVLKNLKGELGFFEYYFESGYWYKYMRSIANYGVRHDRMNITSDGFQNLPVPFPSLAEQQKIADFLIQIDNRIAQLTEKKENLELYKKGITQKIFSQKHRFKDENGKDFPAWEKFKLGDLTIKDGAKNKKNEQLPIYSISNKKGFVPQSNQFEGLDSIERGFDITLYKIIEEKTYAYNPARINVGSIGYSGKLNRVLVSSLYVCFKTKNNVYDDFFNHYLDSYQFNKSVLRSTEGGVRQYLFYENFSLIVLNLPTIKEQEKIASFLNEISQQIRLVNEQLEETKTFKRALLSKLFC